MIILDLNIGHNIPPLLSKDKVFASSLKNIVLICCWGKMWVGGGVNVW